MHVRQIASTLGCVAAGLLIVAPAAQANSKCAGTGTPPTASGVQFASPGGQALYADVFEPSGPGPFAAVIMIHGGSWRYGCRQDVWPEARAVADAGMVAVSIDYRLTKEGATAPDATDDAASAVSWLRANATLYNVASNHIGAFGFSAGGQIAGVLAGERRVTAIASESGDLELPEACDADPTSKNCATRTTYVGCDLGSCPSDWRAQNAVALATNSNPPAFFSQGTNDPLVDHAEAVDYNSALGNMGVAHQFCDLHTGKHAQATDGLTCPATGDSVLDSAVAFLDAHV